MIPKRRELPNPAALFLGLEKIGVAALLATCTYSKVALFLSPGAPVCARGADIASGLRWRAALPVCETLRTCAS